jgi:vitamin B12 transporter
MKKYLIILLTVFFPSSIFPQVGKEMPIYKGDEVVITATRTEMPLWSIGRSVSVISSLDIEHQKKISIIDILKDIPGLDVTQNGGTGQPSSVFIRGAKSEHTLVMIDGVEMNDPISPGRSYDFGHLITNDIEQIEIIKGPSSTLYGSDAIGGVINIITKTGIKKPSFTISGEAGSFGTYKENLQTSGKFNNFNYSLSLSKLDIEGFSSAGEKYGNSEKDGYQNTIFSGKAGLNLFENTSYDFIFHYINSKTDLDNFGGALGDDPNYNAKGKELYIKNQFKVNSFNKRWTQIYSFSFINNKRDYLNDYDIDHPDEFIDSNYKSKLFTFDIQNNIFVNRMNSLVFGFEFEKEKGDTRYYSESMWGKYETLFPNKETNIFGLYFQDNVNIKNTFLPTIGIRYDKHNIFGSATTIQIAPVFLIDKSNTKLRSSYSTGFKAPSLYQLYSQFGDVNLKPEKVKGFDFGIEQYLHNGNIFLSTAYFNNDFTDMVDFSSSLFKYINIGEAKTQGVEFETAFNLLPLLNINASYTYLKTKDISTGEELLRRAKNKGGINVNYNGINKFNFNLNILLIGRRYDLDFSTFPASRKTIEKYIKINLTAIYSIAKNIQFFSRLENLNNAKYEEIFGFGTPGRSIYCGFKFNY